MLSSFVLLDLYAGIKERIGLSPPFGLDLYMIKGPPGRRALLTVGNVSHGETYFFTVALIWALCYNASDGALTLDYKKERIFNCRHRKVSG